MTDQPSAATLAPSFSGADIWAALANQLKGDSVVNIFDAARVMRKIRGVYEKERQIDKARIAELVTLNGELRQHNDALEERNHDQYVALSLVNGWCAGYVAQIKELRQELAALKAGTPPAQREPVTEAGDSFCSPTGAERLIVMKITQVSVEVHEKRAHPSEMGHFDNRVSYTAEIQEGEDANDAVKNLQFQAGQQVAEECDRWIVEIKTQEAQNRARNDLQWIVDRLENRLPTDEDEEKFKGKLALLPGAEHAEWLRKLGKARAEYSRRINNAITVLVEKAKRRVLSLREQEDFDGLLEQLPESERQPCIDKISDALQAFEQSRAPTKTEDEPAYIAMDDDAGVEFSITFDEDDEQ